MRVAFISDTHLGFSKHKVELDSYIYAEQALKIAKEKADLIVLPGDIFDSSSPGEDCLSKAFSILQIFKGFESKAKMIGVVDRRQHNSQITLGMPIVAIPGTHEYKLKEDGPLEVLENAGYLVCLHAGYCKIQKGEEIVNIFGMKGVPEQVARDALKKLSFIPQDGKNILVLHQSFKELLPFNDEMVATLEYKDLPSGFDLYVNGHIHQHKTFELDSGVFLIPGSTINTQVRKSEIKHRKGFVVYDTESKNVEFVEIPIQRQYKYLELDVSNGLEDQEIIFDGLKPVSYSLFGKEVVLEPYVKVKIVGEIDEHKKNILQTIKKRDGFIIDVEKDLSVIEQKIKDIDLKAIRDGAITTAENVFFDNLYSSGFKKSFDLKQVFEYLKEEKPDKVMEHLEKD
ncbi:MAG: metallophosphoesterase [Candidatus ainarchaeum sp.]|nr:metallophosphoesterase [Candidatus ainarchaeum sp.]